VPAPTIHFSLQAGLDTEPRAWRELAKKAEDSGFEALYVADHLGATASPFAALAVAAEATSTLRVGTYVLNAGIRDALALVATADFVLTPDTSIGHAAEAFRRPAVVMFSHGYVERWGLYKTPGHSIASPRRELESLPAEPVLAALADLMHFSE